MGAKKKVEPPPVPQPQPVQDEKVTNNTITAKLSDGSEFKISEELLIKYSNKMRNMIDESNKKDSINFSDFDNEAVESLVEFLNLHKEKEPTKISTPIRTNQNLRFIMEEADAEYIDKIMLKGDHFVLRMLQISTALDVEPLRKRLACGVALKLMKSTL
jgi:hypothetical protein